MRVRTAEVPDVRVQERAVEEVERAERSEAVLDARVRVHERHHAVEAELAQTGRQLAAATRKLPNWDLGITGPTDCTRHQTSRLADTYGRSTHDRKG